MNRTTEQGSYSWRNLLIIMQKRQIQAIRLLSSIVGTTHTFFRKEEVNPRLRFKAADELSEKLKNFMAVCKKNLQHT